MRIPFVSSWYGLFLIIIFDWFHIQNRFVLDLRDRDKTARGRGARALVRIVSEGVFSLLVVSWRVVVSVVLVIRSVVTVFILLESVVVLAVILLTTSSLILLVVSFFLFFSPLFIAFDLSDSVVGVVDAVTA